MRAEMLFFLELVQRRGMDKGARKGPRLYLPKPPKAGTSSTCGPANFFPWCDLVSWVAGCDLCLSLAFERNSWLVTLKTQHAP